jgi:protein-L-isoaspartate(D-aspartate) O-methyltransferase
MKTNKAIMHMLQDIEYEVSITCQLTGITALDERVIEALKTVPRHAFVPVNQQYRAYDNGALSIGHGQTISQPFIVALMSHLLNTQLDDVILEIGCGSGYQSAILSRLVKQVHSLEIVEELARQAARCLQHLNITNVEVHCANGYTGWPAQAPYDGIIVTAAAPYVPQDLIEQLKPGARLVIPVGHACFTQELLVIEKQLDGSTTTQDIMGVIFVPMVENEALQHV